MAGICGKGWQVAKIALDNPAGCAIITDAAEVKTFVV
jgi:hypothetical protein